MMRSYPERLYKLTSWRIGMWPRGSAISRKTRCTQRGGVASSRSSASAGSAQDLSRCKAQPPMAIACYCLPPELPSAACPTRCLSLCEREGGICSKLLQAGVIEFEQFQRGVAAWKFMPLLVARCDHGHLVGVHVVWTFCKSSRLCPQACVFIALLQHAWEESAHQCGWAEARSEDGQSCHVGCCNEYPVLTGCYVLFSMTDALTASTHSVTGLSWKLFQQSPANLLLPSSRLRRLARHPCAWPWHAMAML